MKSKLDAFAFVSWLWYILYVYCLWHNEVIRKISLFNVTLNVTYSCELIKHIDVNLKVYVVKIYCHMTIKMLKDYCVSKLMTVVHK